MPNPGFAKVFSDGIVNGDFEQQPGYCQRCSRQALERAYGSLYAAYMMPSAADTAKAFLNGPQDTYQAWEGLPPDGLQPGDGVYKIVGSGDFGHVGCYAGTVAGIGDNLIGSNSSTSIGRINGALGFRTVEQWGPVGVSVRYKPLGNDPRLILATPDGQYRNVDSAQWETDHFTVNTSQVGGMINEAGPTERVDIRTALAHLGWQLTQTGDHMSDPEPKMYVWCAPLPVPSE